MNCIVYMSNSVSRLDSLEINQLVIQSAKKNKKIGVTGYLYLSNNKFIQYLEGEERHVSSLLDIIREDKRHNVVYINRSTLVRERRFPTWSMRYISNSGTALEAGTTLEGILVNHFRYLTKLTNNGVDTYSEPTDVIWGMIDHLSKHRAGVEETV